jgi:uncharacterized protein (TIGR02145 family)
MRLFIILFALSLSFSQSPEQSIIKTSRINAKKNAKDPLEKNFEGIDGNKLIDVDGNIYTAVKIGSQTWTVENFRSTKFIDGVPIPLVKDSVKWVALSTPGFCYCNNTTNVDTIKKFGALYNWYAVSLKKFVPPGWHVPDTAEWNTLENYLIANGYNWDGTRIGNKIAKSLATKTDWKADWWPSEHPGSIGNDTLKNNRSGFSALPGCGRGYSPPDFGFPGYHGYWWSVTDFLSKRKDSLVYVRGLYFDCDKFGRASNEKHDGFSVRLLKNN